MTLPNLNYEIKDSHLQIINRVDISLRYLREKDFVIIPNLLLQTSVQ